MFTKPWPSIPRRREIKARRDSKYAAWRTCFNWNEASTHVTWEDTQEYGRKLTAKEGVTYRLPTEAKWEYACRAGTQCTDSFGNNDARLSDYAWWGGVFGNGTDKEEHYAHEVAVKRPNAWGLYDMHGNV